MDEVILAAQRLGNEIKNSETYQNMMLANAEVEADPEAQEALSAFRAQRLVLQALENAEDASFPQKEIEATREKLLAMQEKLGEVPSIRRAQEAGDAFETMMGNVNRILEVILNGGSSSCSGSCSTCGGCK